MDYVTIPDIELCTVGMSWPASTGTVTLTFDHLASMAAAADDPHISAPRIKLGHTDPRFDPSGDGLGKWDPTWDGNPVFGTVANLRLEQFGAVLKGDLVAVPSWLAEAMPSAYPTRSMETVHDYESHSGKHYDMVLTGVALGGEWTPAVQDLEDVPDLVRLISQGAELVVTEDEQMAARIAAGAGPGVAAAADVSKVVDLFYAQSEPGDPEYWWWVRAVWTDPNQLIVDDEEGHLYRIPFSSGADGTVTFGDPQEVRETFVDLSSGEKVAAAALSDYPSGPRATFSDRTDPRLPQRSRTSMSDGTAEPEVDLVALRNAYGLPEDATVEQINAKIAEVTAEAAAGDEEQPETDSPEAETETPAEDRQPEPVAASGGEPQTVTLDRSVYEELKRGAEDGTAARKEQIVERREGLLAAAVDDGRIMPSAKDAWRSKLGNSDPAIAAAAEEELNSLEKGLVPVEERGTAASATDEATQAAIDAHFGIRKN